MPESEPKPRPLETVPAGSAQGWKAVLRNGRPVVVHEIPVAPAAAAAAVPRIQRLSEHPHPSLSPILGWGSDTNGVWVAVEPNEGTPLSAVLARGRLTPHAAAALGTSVLSGVAALHEAGVAMGGFDATAVRITANGEVRLAGHPVAAVRGAPSQGDLRADVRSCGMAICAAFGVDPAGAPAPPELPPGLVVTMRSMASGAMGPAVDRALGALREMAGPLMAPDRQTAAQSELALRGGGRDVPAVAPATPAPMREETPAPRPASYDPPPRAVDTYASIPRPAETFTPPASYQSSPPAPAVPAPITPTPPPTPAAPPEPPPAPAEPAPAPEPATFMAEPPAPPAPAPMPAFVTEHPEPAAPEPAPIQEPAAAAAMWTPVADAPAASEPAAPAAEPAPAPESDWPAPGSPVTNPSGPSAVPSTSSTPATPREQSGAPTWSPVQTGSWTPGKGQVRSSDWTGEQTPVPGPVPDELKEAISSPSYVAPVAAAAPSAPSLTEPSYSQPATYMPPEAPAKQPDFVVPTVAPRAPAPKPVERKPSDRGKPAGGGGFSFERPRWVVPAAIGIVLLLVLGGGGAFALSKLGGASSSHVASTTPSANPSHKASPTPTNALREPQPVAPLAAAPLASAQFCQTSNPCRGGVTQLFNCQLPGPCKLDIGIYLSGNAAQVTYQVQFFDKCTGDTKTILGPKTDNVNNQRIWLPAPSNGWAVTLPTAKAAAVYVLVSVTGTTTSIQSDFYSLPGSATSC